MGQTIFFFKRVGFFLVSICLMGSAVYASDEAALIQQVSRLERQLSTLERQIYRGEITAPKPSGSMDSKSSVFSNGGGSGSASPSQLQTMEHEIQRLTASLEEAVHKIDLQSQEIKILKNDMQFRVDELEKKANQPLKSKPVDSVDEEATQLPKKPLEKPLKKAEKKVDSKKPETPDVKSGAKSSDGKLPEDTIADQYNASLELLKKKDYPAALKAFEVFLDHHSDHELAGSAQYWLGEVHFAMKDYVKSSVAFLNAYKNYPSSAKRADSLLKLGQSLAHLGKKKEACATLQKLLTDFPKASNTLKQMAESEKVTNGC